MQFDLEVRSPTSFSVALPIFQVASPDASKIPSKNDLLGVTALILSVCYAEKEFYRIGYYVYNYYTDQKLIDSDPVYPITSKIERRIIDDKPRITIFNIFKNVRMVNWRASPTTPSRPSISAF